MRVDDLCVCDVAACTRDATLARAASLMRRYDIGCLPVVDDDERVIGIVTDRDIALELGRGGRSTGEIRVEDVMSEGVATIGPDEDARDALLEMGRSRVRRLAVVDDDERLRGILSIDDIVSHAAEAPDAETLPADEIVQTLARISRPYAAESGARRPYPAGKKADDGGHRPRFERRKHEPVRRGRTETRGRER